MIFFHVREVIAVSQDKLGKMGKRMVRMICYFNKLSWYLLIFLHAYAVNGTVTLNRKIRTMKRP